MRPDLDDALDDCLRQLRRGTGLEACLAAYPEYVSRLRPLLQTVVAVGRCLVPPAPAAARDAGREVMLAALARRRERQAGRAPLRRLLHTMGRGLAAVMPSSRGARPAWWAAALLLALFALVAAGLATASAASLPGDRLYSLKLAGRALRLSLAADPAAREDLEDRLEARGREEVGRALHAGHVAAVEFTGLVDQAGAGLWVVGGVPVVPPPGIAGEGDRKSVV